MSFLEISLKLGEGFLYTLLIFGVTLIFALPLGLVICFGSRSRFKVISKITRAFVWVIRQRKAANGGDALGEGDVPFDPCAVYIEILRKHGGAGILKVDPHATPLGKSAAVMHVGQRGTVGEGSSAEGGEGGGEV